MSFPKSSALFKALINELRETAKALGYGGLTRNQKTNVYYAFSQIQPSNLGELAACIAFGVQHKPIEEVVNKFVQNRTNGNTEFNPYNKIKGMNEALVKTWGILLYKEQATLLLTELTGKNGELPCTILLDRDMLIKYMKPDYREVLTEEDINRLHEALFEYTRVGMNSYKWCRDMAEIVTRVA